MLQLGYTTENIKRLENCSINCRKQCAKKVVSDSLGLVDFAIALVNSVLNLAKYFEELNFL